MKEDALYILAKRTKATLKNHARPLSALHCVDHVFVQNQQGLLQENKTSLKGWLKSYLWSICNKVDESGRKTKRNRCLRHLIPTSSTDDLMLPGPKSALLNRPDAASPVATFENPEQASNTDDAVPELSTTSATEHTPHSSTRNFPPPEHNTPGVGIYPTPPLLYDAQLALVALPLG